MSKILTSWIETLLRHRTVQVELYGDKIKRKAVKGNPQGGILPPFLWNCVLNSLLLELCSRGFYLQAYADDLAVLVTGADMLWIRGMVQKAINIAANWASAELGTPYLKSGAAATIWKKTAALPLVAS